MEEVDRLYYCEHIFLGIDLKYYVNAFISPCLTQIHIHDAGCSCDTPYLGATKLNKLVLYADCKGLNKREQTFLSTLVGGLENSIEAVDLNTCIE